MMENTNAEESDEQSIEDPYANSDSGSEYQPSENALANSDREIEEEDDVDPEKAPNDVLMDVNQTGSRKRIRKEDNWARNKRKKSRAAGVEYKTKKGYVVPGKKFQIPVCECTNRCNQKISSKESEVLFENFYKLASFDLQTAYIFGQIKVVDKQRCYTDNENSRRNFTRNYYLPDASGCDLKVCKTFFKQTLQISDGRLTRVLKHKTTGTPSKDKRGRHPSANKTPDAKVEEVKQFINRFPAYESHYTRQKSGERKYLAPDLNISIMYNLYKQSYGTPVSQYVFRTIFNKYFNLHFHAPISDSCRKCDGLENKIKGCEDEDRELFKVEKELHLRKAQLARAELKKDGEDASLQENNMTAIAFDMMKTLPTPVLSTGITYYKRQLWTYCLGIHDLAKNIGTMYVWNESVASRGPQEIGSCLLHYCKNFVSTQKLTMYSDQCGGQNRNIKMALICDYIATSQEFSITKIDHKFLVSGHSYLPCDQDFGVIEKEKKFHKDVYVPDHWITVIESARKKVPFVTIKMTKHDFFSTKNLEKAITNRKTDEEGEKVEWMKMQWIRYTSETKHRFQFKYSNSRDVLFCTANVAKRKRVEAVENMGLLYPTGRPIEKKKMANLNELLPYVPPIHHPFYNNLRTTVSAQDDLVDDEEYFSN